jgi:hypothetical protein
MGKKTQQNFLNIDRPKIEDKILYFFTRKSSALLNQEIPRDGPKPSLTSPSVAIGSPPRLAHYRARCCVCPNEVLASLINSGLTSL